LTLIDEACNITISRYPLKDTERKGGVNNMKYRILLDLKDQLFTAVDVNDSNNFGNGTTIEKAISSLKNNNKAA